MKRFRRWLFNVLAISSLLLCIATTAELVRNFWVRDALVQFRYLPPDISIATADFQPLADQQFTDISVVRGELLIARTVRPVGYHGQNSPWSLNHPPDVGLARGPSLLNRCGFAFSTEKPRDYPGAWAIRILFPVWAIAFLAAVMPVWWTVRFRGRAQKPGFCNNCGYGLRATPDVCPECGKMVEKTI
jgi:hypothetical protein